MTLVCVLYLLVGVVRELDAPVGFGPTLVARAFPLAPFFSRSFDSAACIGTVRLSAGQQRSSGAGGATR